MKSNKVISSDDHVVEPAEVWIDRVSSGFKERAPRMVRQDDGFDWWVCDGEKWHCAGVGAQVGKRFEDAHTLKSGSIFEDAPLGGHIPKEHVKDMDIDGVDVSLLYPTVGLSLYWVQDSQLVTDSMRAYNDWIADHCSGHSDRLKGIAIINIDDVRIGVKEMQRCAKIGLVGAAITIQPPDGRSYDLPEYELLWAASEDLGMPLSFHVGTNRPAPGNEWRIAQQWLSRLSYHINASHWVRVCISDMIFGGVFERHDKLQVILVEHELAWIPHFLDKLDERYNRSTMGRNGLRFRDNMQPEDFLKRNVFHSFQEDGRGMRDKDLIGVGNLMWGSDYPHNESTFPRSMEILEDILSDCTEDEKSKIVGGNAARVYGI